MGSVHAILINAIVHYYDYYNRNIMFSKVKYCQTDEVYVFKGRIVSGSCSCSVPHVE